MGMYMVTFFLALLSGFSHGAGVLPDIILNETLGGSVMFITTVNQPFDLVSWTFINESIEILIIQSISADPFFTGPAYENRTTLNTSPTVSLELRNLTSNDSGEYKVSFNLGGSPVTGSTNMMIYTQVSNAVITPNTADYMEFNDTAVLTCSVSSGSSLSYLWLNGSSEVTASEGVQLGDGGSTLTIVSVTRYDQGPFRCHVFNPISNHTSEPVELNINFGPENTTMKVSPSKDYYEDGSTLNLTCSADSMPTALFYWFLNGKMLNIPYTGPELIINLNIGQSGNYSCQAFNSKTLRYHMSEASVVTVLGISCPHPTDDISAAGAAGITAACFMAVIAGFFIVRTNKTCGPSRTSDAQKPRESEDVGLHVYENQSPPIKNESPHIYEN